MWITPQGSFLSWLDVSGEVHAFFFFLKVVFVMDSGCSLRARLRALPDGSAATTRAQMLPPA